VGGWVGRLVVTAVISKSIAGVSVFVVNLMIPGSEDYLTTSIRITVSGDTGRSLTVLLLT